MSIADVKKHKKRCKKVMSGWKIAALVDGKFDGEEYGFDFKEGGFFDDKDIS